MKDIYKNRIKKIPTGVDDFGKLLGNHFYYVDKTLFIKELLDNFSEVNLFTRPRRFGKSLNISMFQYFFDNLYARDAHLFDGLAISKEDEYYKSYQNQFPVIKLTLKGAVGENFEEAFESLQSIIADEFKRHNYLLTVGNLSENDKLLYQALQDEKAGLIQCRRSLKFLSDLLCAHYKKKVIILIDEYDVPIEKAHFFGYYDKMVNFVRNFFGDALKSNPSLFFSVITGCLRISKESIFIGLNNFDVISITSNAYSEHFGFTHDDVGEILAYYQLETQLDKMGDWYNGYLFGNTVVYNPWSVIKFTSKLRSGEIFPESYWANTSSNEIIRQLIDVSDTSTKDEIEKLLKGDSITKPIKEDIVYAEVTKNMDNLWSFLFFTGYLKKVRHFQKDVNIQYELKIPNKEVQYIFENHIAEWFSDLVKVREIRMLYQSIIDGDVQNISDEISKYLLEVISYMDSAENFYHGFLSGILRSMDGYHVKSNRETGNGRSDIFILPNIARHQAYIIEIKIAKKSADLELKCDEALAQIEGKGYAEELALDGYINIVKYGIAFYKKICLVKKEG